ncbi:hypothetical protein BVC80_243g32 [Macleaya cordata]|uniref:Heat shock protein DnaJ n=1 Tax=Macleaya cordata TaxID=56857 RepID=A0A200R124_MACCD|nr:hypothetical protein BVC80_243g32 [Macleaya cordata]
METAFTISSISSPTPGLKSSLDRNSKLLLKGREYINHSISHKRLISLSSANWAGSRSVGDVHRVRSSLESLFCYDKPIPEEIIEKPIGLSLEEREIGENTPCTDCQAKGAILCATCSGSGLYVDSILECQGIIVKVRCLGCGGTGNIMCSDCGGRGHLGVK